jgi:hypothetical protein
LTAPLPRGCPPLPSGSADNFRWQVISPNITNGTFSLLIRQGNDSTNSPSVVETWGPLSLDPLSSNYIQKVIANQTRTVSKDNGQYYIQLKGKQNYTLFAKAIGEDTVSNPDLVAMKYPLASAAWFYTKNNIHLIADKGATNEVVTMVTKRVNGGTIGLADRIKHFKEYYSLLT